MIQNLHRVYLDRMNINIASPKQQPKSARALSLFPMFSHKSNRPTKKMNLSPGIKALEEPIITQQNTFLEGGDDLEKGRIFPLDYCNHLLLRKTDDATGFGLTRMGNGVTVMAMVFLSSSLMYLSENEEQEMFGLKPSSLVTAIGTVSGILSAIMLPFMGAVVDGTPHRRQVGIISSFLLVTIQTIQICTIKETWKYMALLQCLNGFIFQVATLAAYSYLPEMAREIGESRMTKYSSKFFIMMFAFESFYLVIVIGVSIHYNMDDVQTSAVAQCINVLGAGWCYYNGWKYLTNRPGTSQSGDNRSLFSSGFVQVYRTASGICKHYSASLGWYLLAVMFAEAGTNALTLVSVSYLKEAIDFSGTEIGIMFFIVIICTIPGSALGAFVTYKTNPSTSMKLQLLFFSLVNFAAFTMLSEPEHQDLAYYFGILWGISLGWFYPTESLIFSMTMPKGQEAELAGFFLYCTQIIGWVPPLVFTLMNENDLSLNLAGMHLNVYLFIAFICYCCMAPWDACVAAAEENKMLSDQEKTTELPEVL